jgi:hypothetical protein
MKNTGLRRPRPSATRIVLGVALFAIGSLELGCYPKVAAPPGALSANSVASASTRWPGVTPESLSAGHDLFLAKCDQCHGYPDLTAISDERWPGILDSMAKKAHLSAEERDEVQHYILASRSEQTTR